jgi:peptidyl-prolyl cis-trans isomerase D
MFKFLRSNAKFFYWIIAATFVAFIFLAWGMDVAGSRGGAPRGGDTIGEVNGQPISAWQYDRAVQTIQENFRRNAQGRELTTNQVALARAQAWDQMVREAILAQEVEARGLTVSDDEVLRIFKENPPPELLQMFADENGQPDMQAYYAALGNPDSGIDWAEVEAWVRRTIPRQKLIQMITAGVSVSETEVRELYERQTQRFVAEYVGVELKSLLEDHEPSEQEIQAYYEAHPGDYWQAEQATVRAVAWELAPAPSDYDEVRQLALEIKNEIESGERTFEDAAAVYSEDGTADAGGDLGTFDRNRMVEPFTEVAFSLPVGEISDPVETQFGYHLIEVLEQETDEEGEVARVHARHILLRITPSEATRDAVFEHAEDFRARVTAENFLTLAEQDTTAEVLDPRPFAEGRDIPGLRQSAAGGRFAFLAEPGEISPVLSTDDHVYIVMAEGIEPAGPQPLEDVRGQVELAVKREKQTEEARRQLSPAVGRIQLGEAMDEVAEDLGLVHGVTDTVGADGNVPQVGFRTAFNLAALETPAGELVPEVATNQGVYALEVLWRSEFDADQYAARRQMLRQRLLQQRQAEVLEAWFQEKIAAAEVEDRRVERRLL